MCEYGISMFHEIEITKCRYWFAIKDPFFNAIMIEYGALKQVKTIDDGR